jgi:hypothetical protein
VRGGALAVVLLAAALGPAGLAEAHSPRADARLSRIGPAGEFALTGADGLASPSPISAARSWR